jgi:VanZ family protein
MPSSWCVRKHARSKTVALSNNTAALSNRPQKLMLSNLIQTVFTRPQARNLWRAVLLLLLIVISYLALAPVPPKSISSGWDKLNHTLAFASLAFCGHWSLAPGRARWLFLPLALLAYGAAIELLQLNIPGRDGEWADLFADTVGMTLGLSAAAFINYSQK